MSPTSTFHHLTTWRKTTKTPYPGPLIPSGQSSIQPHDLAWNSLHLICVIFVHISESTLTSGYGVSNAFVGVTQRPGVAPSRRISHPLSRAVSPSFHGPSESEASLISGGNLYHGVPLPHDGATNNTSFISTSSSHDLTTHRRVNTYVWSCNGFCTWCARTRCR